MSFQQQRSKRSAHLLGARKGNNRLSTLMNPLLQPHRPARSRSCQKYILYVSFRELRWDDWIIAPGGYGAFYCAGSCDFPFPHDVTATNHAVIQILAHHMLSHDIPKPCCAPSKLKPISLLYSQNEVITHIRRHRGMIAEKCACQ